MNVEQHVSSSTITSRIVPLIAIVTLDMATQILALFSAMDNDSLKDAESRQGDDHSLTTTMAFAAAGGQAACQIALLFWFFFLVWRTFLFRFGQLKQLLTKEIPVVLLMPVNFLTFALVNYVRFQFLMISGKDDILTLYTNWIYLVALVIRIFFSLYYYGACLKTAVQIGHPSYYKPGKWLTA